MPDILTSRLQERIDRVFEARERHLEDLRRREQAAERERYERAVRFKELVDGVIRPVLNAGGDRLRELGHEFDITAHGLRDDGRFGDDQHIRFNLSLGGRGDHAFAHAGEASLGFAASGSGPAVEATLRVLGRDRAAMSPYRRSHEETRVLEPGDVTPQVVEELLLAFLEAAVESTYAANDERAPG